MILYITRGRWDAITSKCVQGWEGKSLNHRGEKQKPTRMISVKDLSFTEAVQIKTTTLD